MFVSPDAECAHLDGTHVRHIDPDVLPHFVLGAALFGSGGGGGLDTVVALAELALRDRAALPVTTAQALPADAWVAHVAVMGAPLTMSEKLPTGTEFALAAASLATKAGVELGAVSCLSVGGVNAVLGVLAAAHLELPLVDGDAMGRAFPRLEQTVLAAGGRTANPLGLVCPKGNFVLVETESHVDASRIASAVVMGMGGWAALAVHLVQASELVTEGHPGTVTRAVRLGRALARTARSRHRDPAALATALEGELVFDGTVVEIERSRLAGEPSVVVLIGGPEEAQVARVDALQEYLIVAVDGVVKATVPDLICLVTAAGAVLELDALRLGQRVAVLSLPCEPRWRRPEALPLVVPRAFGIDLPERIGRSRPAGDQDDGLDIEGRHEETRE